MNAKDFFRSILQKDLPKNNIIHSLYTKPKRDKGLEALHFDYITSNMMQQADLLTLPNDKGYDKCLVVVDQGCRLCDAEPLKSKTAETVLQAFKTIYNRKIIGIPKVLTCDQGTEFKSVCKQGLEAMGITVTFVKEGRHRSVGLVERKNQTIGTLIHKLLNHDAEAGHITTQWKQVLPDLIAVINETIGKSKVKHKFIDQPVGKETRDGYITQLLNVGDKVRVQLDNPQNIDGTKIIGKFRSSDIRFNPKIEIIKFILLKPDQPVTYQLVGDPYQISYTRNQLQLVKANEQKPEKPILQPEVEEGFRRLEVEKLLERRKEGKIIYYLIKWRGIPKANATWEKRDELIKDIPQLITRFDKKLEETEKKPKKKVKK